MIYRKVLCIETSISLGFLQKFEGAAGEFKEALGSRHPLILHVPSICSAVCDRLVMAPALTETEISGLMMSMMCVRVCVLIRVCLRT